MSQSERKCANCQKPASKLLVRADLGEQDERVLTCGDKACVPPEGQWDEYPMEVKA